MEKKLSTVVISITPFDHNGGLDEPALRQQLARLRAAGVCVYVAGSGSSEAYSLAPDERDRVLAIAVEELKGRVPVRAMGCEPRVIGEMVEFVRAAERARVDAAQICSLDIGHGSAPTLAEMELYYRTVIESASLPLYLSSHRAAGYFLPIDLVERLVERYPHIAGVAYSGPDSGYIAELIARVGDRIEVHSAGPANALTVLGLGGNGFMGGEGNLLPEMFPAVISAWQDKDYPRLHETYGQLMALTTLNKRYGGSAMRAMKPLMNAFGLPGGNLRAPRLPISAAELEKVVQEVITLKLPGLPPRVTP
jgi:dihydrodipicolinate synthase/N-acetylneuraminate lyase